MVRNSYSGRKDALSHSLSFRALALLSILSVLAFLTCTKEDDIGVRPKLILFISLDTARADHFGFMGNKNVRTPYLDALAGESIVFTDYMTVVPTTLASHVSLFTGKYPHHHGTPRNGYMVNRDNMMLPEILRDAGYHTAGFAAAFALHSRFNFAQGFDHYDETFSVRAGAEGAGQEQRRAEEVTDAVIAHLDETGIKDHLFLFVHYFDPHTPYTAPAPYDTIYDRRGRKDLPPVDYFRGHQEDPSPRLMRDVRRKELQYAAEITYMDYHVGRLLSHLRGKGVLDDALVVVTSDHGESLWEHKEVFNHGFRVYRSTMNCVCLIHLPGGERGGTEVGLPIASIDVLPSVLAFLGVELPAGVDGDAIDLRTLDGMRPSRVRFGQASKPWEHIETDPRWANMTKSRCVREGPFKFIQTPYQGIEELYNVHTDPKETDNLLGNPSVEQIRLADHLRRELETWAASADPLPSEFEPSQTQDTIKRLRSLGYLR
jgi:arylsulfatase A-like enzyme